MSSRTSALRALPLSMLAAACLVACAPQRGVPSAGPPVPVASPATPAAPPSASQSSSWTVDGYKKDAARWIYDANRNYLYDGAPPPVLKSVVVLSIAVDAAGKPTRVAVVRSNGYADLDKLAVQSVQRAAPLPPPSRMIAHGRGMEYTETWLFREDGRFQLRSLAQAQQTGLE